MPRSVSGPSLGSGRGEVAFEAWLRRELGRLYGAALAEPVPEELSRLLGTRLAETGAVMPGATPG
jgi:hypothetical protein